MFPAFAIEFEGLTGDKANPEGGTHVGSWFLTGNGYEIKKIMGGVKSLGKS